MKVLPRHVEEILDGALVCILTYLDNRGHPFSHPMLPLYDDKDGKIYFTSSILFSRKIEHIKNNPRVSVLFYGRDFIKSDEYNVVQVKGDAKVIEGNLSDEWTMLLPLWRKKEPYIDAYLKQRFALPLFWERVIIEVSPRVVTVWRNGDMSSKPEIIEVV